jgi:hypothetical protein
MTMDSSTSRLVGTWRQTAPPACASSYPALLEFQSNGLYRGTTDPPGRFATWDVGTWTVHGGDLAMSTANDAVVRYRFTLVDDVLQVSDPAGCTFAYRRGA